MRLSMAGSLACAGRRGVIWLLGDKGLLFLTGHGLLFGGTACTIFFQLLNLTINRERQLQLDCIVDFSLFHWD